MKSPYQVLGVPGNASADDIEIAFEKAKRLYTPQRLADDEGALERFNAIKSAYDVLRNADFRAAIDRKLAAGGTIRSAPTPVVAAKESSPVRTMLIAGVCLVAVLFSAGAYVHRKNAETRREQAEMEIAKRKLDAEEAQQKRAAEARADAERRNAQARSDANDHRARMDAQFSSARVMIEAQRQDMNALQAQRIAAADEARRENEFRNQQRRDQQEAQMRLARDKARIRELCMQQYRRPDC